jgi:hypothetical protein
MKAVLIAAALAGVGGQIRRYQELTKLPRGLACARSALLIIALAISTPAVAQHAHGSQKGPNGGLMVDVAGVHAELLASGATIIIRFFDGGKRVLPTEGFTASALISTGADREMVTLSSSGQNALIGKAKQIIPEGATISVTLRTAAGVSGQVHFKQ